MATDNTVSLACDVDALNTLLRGEISAVETYDQAIEKFTDPTYRPLSNVLTRIRDEHSEAVGVLRDRVRVCGGTPSDGAGAWGVFVKTVEGAAKLLGPQTALSALKQGEQHGVGEYESAMKNDDVSVECKYLIRSEMMPKCQDHIVTLDRLIEQLDKKNGG